jgi:Coenzyme PQQ synthesis protein D (PqqD)
LELKIKILPKTRTNNLLVQELESELLIYDLSNNKAFCLNETSALVFQLCDGKRTVLEIADALSVKLKTLVSEDYVRLTLHELNRDGLLENSDEVKAYLNGVNRREIVKKIGFASMIALPLVSSVIAPSAAMAASQPINCSPTPLAPGCPISGTVFISNPCSPSVAFSYNFDCDGIFGSQCSSGNAIYQIGSCVDVGSKGSFTCVCS